ncbi:alpha/beta fold hydrolase [Filimonas effusa]|uniref:Redoxin domain-containing protein n=1 Tax=Filimonas effusa TaxID=2508721 RepID=A0A4Q1DBN2_9BACT|nr:alpha/beta fold hydrolase [Filimonas effusa]RXK86852.1 redoxin domain-containing protein [Filimonas effusa]
MKKIFSLVACCFVLAGLVKAQDGRIAVTPVRPVGGNEITILYYPEAILQNENQVKGVIYMYDTTYRWQTFDLPLTRLGDTAWKGNFTLPADAAFLAFKFKGDSATDNRRDTGYFHMVDAATGGLAAGAEAGYGLLRSPSYELGVPGYFNDFTISDTATYMWLSNEIMRHRNLAPRKLVIPYLKASLKFKEATMAAAARAAAYLSSLPDKSEQDLLKVYVIYRDFLKNAQAADSLSKAILAKYPGGHLARWQAYREYLGAKDAKAQLQTSRALITKFPPSEADADINNVMGIDYNRVFRSLLMIGIQNDTILKQFAPIAPFDRLPELYYKAVEIPFDIQKSKTAAEVYPLAKLILDRMAFYKANKPAASWSYSPEEWAAYCDEMFRYTNIIQIAILQATGRTQEALELANKAQGYLKYSRARLNDIQAALLQGKGNEKALREVLENSIRFNQATATIIAMAKKQYKATHPKATAGEVDSYLESLKDAHTIELMREEVKNAIVSYTAEDFSLQERNAGIVKLSDLKGKTVVLDFWATWCAPCKAGMAGMKLALEKYANDPDVVFFFVDTQEHDAGYKEKVNAFLKQMGYNNFRVLFDKGEETYAKYASQIHTSGIPFKVVINKEGKLVFANVGYKGSPTALADEITMMIDMAKGEDDSKVQAPRPPYPYTSERIQYYNADSSIHFGATITIPANAKNCPAAVILSGTGQQDRDGVMAGHPMFAVIADELSRKGIVVLRVDDRGVGETTGDYYTTTTRQFSEDALAGINYLLSRKEVDPRKTGLIGHSEGGIAACMAAAASEKVRFVVSLSSMGISGLEALRLQNDVIIDKSPATPTNKIRFKAANSAFFPVAFKYADASDLEARLREAYKKWHIEDSIFVAAQPPKETDHFFYPFEGYVRQATGPWYRGFITYDPAKVLPLIKVPVLAINGEKDIISIADENLAGFKKYIPAKQLQTWKVPGLNHLYQHCTTCTTDEYAKLKETFAPEVSERLVSFIGSL